MRSLRVGSLLLLSSLSIAGCATGGGLARGSAERVDLASITVAAPARALAKRGVLHLVVEPFPEHVTAEVRELLPDQVSFLRAPRVLGTVEVDGVKAALASRAEAIVRRAFAEVHEGAAPAGALDGRLRFRAIEVKIDVARPPMTLMDVSSCDRTGKSNASDALSESTTTFGAVPEDQQRAYVHVAAELELSRASSSEGQLVSLNETVPIVGSSDGRPLGTRDLEAMFEEALRRAFIGFGDQLPAAIVHFDQPEKTIEALMREVCADKPGE